MASATFDSAGCFCGAVERAMVYGGISCHSLHALRGEIGMFRGWYFPGACMAPGVRMIGCWVLDVPDLVGSLSEGFR
eukprot:5828812-Prymnesium_polylepis.1